MTYLMYIMAIAMLLLFTIKPRPKLSFIELAMLTVGYALLSFMVWQ